MPKLLLFFELYRAIKNYPSIIPAKKRILLNSPLVFRGNFWGQWKTRGDFQWPQKCSFFFYFAQSLSLRYLSYSLILIFYQKKQPQTWNEVMPFVQVCNCTRDWILIPKSVNGTLLLGRRTQHKCFCRDARKQCNWKRFTFIVILLMLLMLIWKKKWTKISFCDRIKVKKKRSSMLIESRE